MGVGQAMWVRDIDRMSPDWLIKQLSLHTGVSEESILNCSLLAYKGLLYREYKSSGKQYWILPLIKVDSINRHHGVQFCAKCLAEDPVPYFRKRWRVAFYTMCTKHQCMLHDRCPACDATVMFHRGEMGKIGQNESDSITLCHACGFDLRDAPVSPPTIYDDSAYQTWLPALQMLEGGKVDNRYDLAFFEVLSQLCQILLASYKHVHLREYVSKMIGAPSIRLYIKRKPFEYYPLKDRHVVIQLAMWLMTDPESRILDAWRNKAVRYSVLKKDFEGMPEWYAEIVGRCSDWRAVKSK